MISEEYQVLIEKERGRIKVNLDFIPLFDISQLKSSRTNFIILMKNKSKTLIIEKPIQQKKKIKPAINLTKKFNQDDKLWSRK